MLIGNVGDYPANKFESWQCHGVRLFSVMVEVLVGNFFAIIGLYSGFTNGRSFEVFAQILSIVLIWYFQESLSF